MVIGSSKMMIKTFASVSLGTFENLSGLTAVLFYEMRHWQGWRKYATFPSKLGTQRVL